MPRPLAAVVPTLSWLSAVYFDDADRPARPFRVPRVYAPAFVNVDWHV